MHEPIRHGAVFLCTSMRRVFAGCVAFAGFLAVAGPASATPYDTLTSIAGSYNMFLLGNLGTAASPYTSSVQGSVAVAGNAYMSGAAIDSGFYGTAGEVVGGNLIETGGVTDGNVFVGGASANFAGGATVVGNVTLTASASALTYGYSLAPTGIYVTPTTVVNVPAYMNGFVHTSGGSAAPVDLYGAATDVVNASAALGALAGNAVISAGGTLTVTLASSGLNVVNLTLPDNATVTGVNIVTANGATPTGVVLNVNGNNLKFTGGTYTTGTLADSAVLYNFTDATALSFSSLAFEGTLLAPLATVSFANGRIDGSLIAANFLGSVPLSQQGFTAPLPAYAIRGASVSEPATLTLFLPPLAMLVFHRRSRAARRASRF
jgi:choice-of-anchor A domain-containing protein